LSGAPASPEANTFNRLFGPARVIFCCGQPLGWADRVVGEASPNAWWRWRHAVQGGAPCAPELQGV